SIISSDLRIEGNLHSNGDVQVDGQVSGDISSKTLTLGEGSQVNGSVNADTVRVCGT
ncbi:MAG: polymer-forming cytoskeletal protein, partial [Desulfuromonadales bacterium]|nr:polymer-forming cytoskeletal protein [Desulfuromonadales bacterium]